MSGITMAQKVEKEEAIKELRDKIKAGDTLYTKLVHCSKSGMMRVVDVFIIRDNVPLRYSWSVAQAAGFKYNRKHEGVEVGGCGMDVGFEVVYNLSRVLFADGFKCIGKENRCPANDHTNDPWEENYSTDRVHSDAGYALRHRWL